MEIHGGPNSRKRRKPADPEWIKFLSEDEREADRKKQWYESSLADAGLPVRIVNTLEDNGIMTVGELCQQTKDRLNKISNLGEVTIKRCRALLNKLELPNKLNSE